ncbi:MAG: nucleoside-diphosphate kinase [Phycisphaerales bacterium]
MQTTLIILSPTPSSAGWPARSSPVSNAGPAASRARLMLVPKELAEKHYAEHKGKPFYDGLIQFVTSSPVMVLAIRGLEAVTVCRTLIGTRPMSATANPGTIRGDFGMSGGYNLVHGSDSPESAERELALWFKKEELTDVARTADKWVYDPSDL